MSCFTPDLCASIQNQTGLTDVYVAGLPAVAPNSIHAIIPGFPTDGLLSEPEQVAPSVTARVREGAYVIKPVADSPGSTTLSQGVIDALVVASKQQGKQTVCHAGAYEATRMALAGNVSQVHHVPLDFPLNTTLLDRYIEQGTISCPTLIMMMAVSNTLASTGVVCFPVANVSAAALHAAGVSILAGSDSN